MAITRSTKRTNKIRLTKISSFRFLKTPGTISIKRERFTRQFWLECQGEWKGIKEDKK